MRGLREGLKPKIVLQPRAAPTLAVTAASVEESDRAKYGSSCGGYEGRCRSGNRGRSGSDSGAGWWWRAVAATTRRTKSGPTRGVWVWTVCYELGN